MKERKVKAEIYSRVSGYFRPVDQWNRGKQEEYSLRKKAIIDENYLVPEAVLTETRQPIC